MVDIQSKEIIDKMSDELKVQPAMLLPRELGKEILPVYNVNPPRIVNVVAEASGATTTAFTIFTTPTNRDFFLTHIGTSVSKDVSCDLTLITIQGTIGGQVVRFISDRFQTLTAETFNHSENLIQPIKLDRGSTIVFAGAFGVGTCVKDGVIYGYTTDPQ